MKRLEDKEKLEVTRYKLLRYCHHETCKLVGECPTAHEKCKENLGLDTAIAWMVALLLRRILSKSPAESLCEKECFGIMLLRDVVLLHKNQFPVLWQLVEESWGYVLTLFEEQKARR